MFVLFQRSKKEFVNILDIKNITKKALLYYFSKVTLVQPIFPPKGGFILEILIQA